MALMLEWTDEDTGMTLPDAYVRLHSISGGKRPTNMLDPDSLTWGLDIHVDVWVSEEQYHDPKKTYFRQRAYSFSIEVDESGGIVDGDNFITQSYNYLKSLEEYAGAIDV